jgi:hypothetical protein
VSVIAGEATDVASKPARSASKLLRAVVGLLLIESLLISGRTELFHPTTFATDPSNYAAGGQRIAAGNELYALTAGDRPVPADNPPYWTVPLLSPPGAAIIWGLPALLGVSTLAIVLWWVLGASLTFAWTIFVALRGSLGAVILAAALTPMTAVTAISGNLNAFLMPLMIAAWYLSRDKADERRSFVAGLLVALGAWLKLTPILLLPWLIATRRWSAVTGALIGLVVFGLIGVAIAGWDAHIQFLTAGSQSATGGVTGAGPETLALLLGVPASIARFIPALVALGSIGWVVWFRNRPGWAFAGAVAGVVMFTPVIRWESYSMLLAAAAPWVDVRSRRLSVGRTARLATIAAAAIVVLIGSFVAVSRAGVSSVGIQNSARGPIVVRFVGPDLTSASFGYSVAGGAAGWAWADQGGQFVGDVVVFDDQCHQLFRGTITGASLVVSVNTPGGVTLVTPTSAAAVSSAYLTYTTKCQEQLGPPRP